MSVHDSRIRIFVAEWLGEPLRAWVVAHWRGLRALTPPETASTLGLMVRRLSTVWPATLSIVVGVVMASIPQGRDLIFDPTNLVDGLRLALITISMWTIPAHLGSRMLLDRRHGANGATTSDSPLLDTWTARDLGLATLVVMLSLTIYGASSVMGVTAVVDGPFTADARRFLLPLSLMMFLLVVGYFAYLGARAVRKKSRGPEGVVSEHRETILIAYAVVQAVIAAFAMFAPMTLANHVGRLALVPILAGGAIMPIVILTRVLASGERCRKWGGTLILAAAIALFAAVLDSANPFHDVRLVPSDPPAKTDIPRQTPLGTAISEWKKANCRETAQPGTDCRALLIAADGGASRAAFQVATVIGALLDETRVGGGALPAITPRIFAMSGVSGGSLGVATVRAALDASTDGKPPCRPENSPLRSHWMWSSLSGGDAPDPKESWRACLQILVTGDYLTPAFVGLALRDWWMPVVAELGRGVGSNFGLADRSTMLELAMERHFAAFTTGDVDSCERDGTGLCRPFGWPNLKQKKPEDVTKALPWTPLLLLNSTDVEMGRPIIVSEIDLASRATRPRSDGAAGVFLDRYPTSYDFFELTGAVRSDEVPPEKRLTPGLRLSTAIVASARFPIVSTHGVVRNGKREVVGRLTDGGYFDNSGLSALLPIIEEMQRQGLVPIVLHIGNDPMELPDRTNREKRRALPGRLARDVPYLASVGDGVMDGIANQILSPLSSLTNSRQGHVDQAKAAAIQLVGPQAFISAGVKTRIVSRGSSARLVCPAGTFGSSDVSMSWWLSPVTQRFLDLQLCDEVGPGAAPTPYSGNPSTAAAIRRVLRSLPCAGADCRPGTSLDLGQNLEKIVFIGLWKALDTRFLSVLPQMLPDLLSAPGSVPQGPDPVGK